MKEVDTWLETLWSESTAVACPVLGSVSEGGRHTARDTVVRVYCRCLSCAGKCK